MYLSLFALQLLFTFWLEKGLLYSLQLAVKQIVCGSWLFFLFLTQTRAYHFGQALVHGRGSYVATGRGYSLEPGKFVDLYKSYAQVRLMCDPSPALWGGGVCGAGEKSEEEGQAKENMRWRASGSKRRGVGEADKVLEGYRVGASDLESHAGRQERTR